MTVGEKIQLYRKKIGISQEELGQKMLVSRQTVSLWEMDKTLPTVDNLLRLKEIFSVSVDELLCEAQETEETPETPKESYVFQYEPSELQAIFSKMYAPVLKRMVIFALACIFFFLLFIAAKAHTIILGLILGYFLLGMLFYVKGYFAYKKAWQNSAIRVTESTYSYEIFDGYFVVNIARNEEILRMQKIYFDDIEKMQTLDQYLILQSSGQSYILRREALISDSALLNWRKPVSNPIEPKKTKGILKIISLLFLLSSCMLGGALLGGAILSGFYPGIKDYLWGFLLCLPMPVASVVFGYYLKGRGYKYKLNIIVGFVMAALLCVFGYISFV